MYSQTKTDSSFKQTMSNPQETSDFVAEPNGETTVVQINDDEALVSKLTPPEPTTSQQWKQVGEQVSSIVDNLPDYITGFYSRYKRIIITFGWVFLAFASVKLVLALIDAINDIPLLELFLELIGLSYVVWFSYRYLISADSRKELYAEFNSIKEQVLGTKS